MKREYMLDDWSDEGDIYSEDKILELVDDDEISPEEAGFMWGYGAG